MTFRGREIPLSRKLIQWVQESVDPNDNIYVASLSQYTFISELGKGRFGKVCKYINNETMTNIIIKVVKMTIFDHWSQDEEKLSSRFQVFLNEFRHLHRISITNDRIVNQLGIHVDGSSLYVLTEFVPNGSVKQYIEKGIITEDKALKYLTETVEALDYLHTLNPPIIHTDIKAANLLITITDSIKLGNFGLVRDLAIDGMGLSVASEVTKDFRGSILYIAPEVLTSEIGAGNRKAFSLSADIWALGCTFIEMLVKYPPHYEYFQQIGYNQNEIKERAAGTTSSRLPYNAAVLIPSSSDFVKSLVDKMFEIDPVKRATSSDLLHLIKNRNCEPKKSEIIEETDTIPRFRIEPPTPTSNLDEEATRQIIHEEYIPLETIVGGVTRTARPTHKKKQTTFDRISTLFIYLLTQAFYFIKILFNSVAYVVIFITVGISTLAFFLFVAYVIVLFFRYLMRLSCHCDLSAPQYLVISGILLILLFALLFSCCMIGIGEAKHRISNGLFEDTTIFKPKPTKDVKLCGVTVLKGQKSDEVEEVISPLNTAAAQNDFYYN